MLPLRREIADGCCIYGEVQLILFCNKFTHRSVFINFFRVCYLWYVPEFFAAYTVFERAQNLRAEGS